MLSRRIGIDLGSSTVRIYVKGAGVVFNEPADHKRTLHELIGKANGRPRIFRPDVVVSVPSAVDASERRAVTEAAMSAGARQVWLVDEPIAAAMGAGLPIGEVRASAICELGATTTEIAVISRSGTAVGVSLSVGGNDLDRAIATALGIDLREAEAVKIAVGSAVALQDPLVTTVDGREVTSNGILEAIERPLRRIANAVRDVISQAPAALAADIKDRGIVLSGGGAQLRGIDRYVSLHAGISARVAEQPQTSVVRGTGLALENFEVLKRNQSFLR